MARKGKMQLGKERRLRKGGRGIKREGGRVGIL